MQIKSDKLSFNCSLLILPNRWNQKQKKNGYNLIISFNQSYYSIYSLQCGL